MFIPNFPDGAEAIERNGEMSALPAAGFIPKLIHSTLT
jgi:hypothetical protein